MAKPPSGMEKIRLVAGTASVKTASVKTASVERAGVETAGVGTGALESLP